MDLCVGSDNFIVGGGAFAHASLLPASLALESFGVALTQPCFLQHDRWIPDPASRHPNIAKGKTYAHDEVEGRTLRSSRTRSRMHLRKMLTAIGTTTRGTR